MGYAGGTKENPTYRSLGDHAETIQIDYDPTIISYDKLLDIFWASHNPEKLSWSRQYMSAIFFQNDMQKKLAMETRDREAVRIKGKIFTEIAHFTRFYMAEAYHQKYYLQQEPELMNEFRIIYPAAGDFVASTAAARVNGYVGGYGTFAALQAEMSSLGLSPEGSKELMDIVNAFGY